MRDENERPNDRFPNRGRPGPLLLLAVLSVACLRPSSASAAAELTGELSERMQSASPSELLPVVLTVEPTLDLAALEEELASRGITTRWRRHQIVVERAREHAARSQEALISRLDREAAGGNVRDVRSYWITNAIAFRARPELLQQLAGDPGVGPSRIHLDSPVHLKEGEQGTVGPLQQVAGDLAPNLAAIRVDEVWARGLTGSGRLVCQFDAGVEGDHSSFGDRWRGRQEGVPWEEAWFDPYTGSEFPFGVDQGHGTGTLGVLLGTQPEGPPLGVAYEAAWIAAGVVIRYNVSSILAAFEWAADPDGDPSTIDDVPDVINHSWGTRDDCGSEYWDAIDLCEAAGIVNIIAVDNSGPGPASVNSPESRAASPYANFSVGGVDTNEDGYPVRTTSGRGPSPCDGTSIKPEIVGPGTLIPGVGPRDSYGIFWSGTSFAAPHVSGVATLLRQLDPSLTVVEVKNALLATAQDLGPPGEDNDTGFGLVDAVAAVQWVERHISPSPPPWSALGPTGPAPVALLRWAPPRYLGRAEVPALAGYRIYRTPVGTPFGDGPLVEVGDFPTEFWDREAEGPVRYLVTAVYADGSESEPTAPVEIDIISGLAEDPDEPASPGTQAGAYPAGSSETFWGLRLRPNPFQGSSEILLQLRERGSARLEVIDGAGRKVRTLVDRELPPGVHSRIWDGRDDRGKTLPSGIYFVRLTGPGQGASFRIRVAHLR